MNNYYTHKKSGVDYIFVQAALLQSDKGVWGDCVIYKNKEGMTFVREKLDWDRSFTEKIFTEEELQEINSLRKELLEKINDLGKPKFYKLLHKPTGLFYQPVKHRIGNLGTIGKVYAARKPEVPSQIKLCGTYKKNLCKREQLIKDFFNFEGYKDEYADTPPTYWEVIKIY